MCHDLITWTNFSFHQCKLISLRNFEVTIFIALMSMAFFMIAIAWVFDEIFELFVLKASLRLNCWREKSINFIFGACLVTELVTFAGSLELITKNEQTKLISINRRLDDKRQRNSSESEKWKKREERNCPRFFEAKFLRFSLYVLRERNVTEANELNVYLEFVLCVLLETNGMHVYNEWLLLPKLMCN